MNYGLPTGSNITYGSPGFPAWVYQLADAFGLQASTYPGHQESERAEAGFAPNPQHLNRGIDWTGPVNKMQAFADYLRNHRSYVEQVICQNPTTGERVGVAGGDDVTTTAYYADDYGNHTDHVHTRQSQPIPLPGKESSVPSQRPDFNEYAVWSPNSQSRNGTKVDLFLLHTQEGDGNADQLARWLGGNVSASYHYTISMDPRDKGITVCDVVDTDYASWSVLSANNRSINLCFAGSKAGWTRQQWIDNVGRAIDVAAYIAVQDCKKYGIPTTVISPPYRGGRAGISDHAYVTKVLGDGTHTDVGPNFPWDIFAAAVNKYANPTSAPQPAPPATNNPLASMTDRQLLEAIYRRIDGLAIGVSK
jgi:N-acetyl-anhydromuramyl-L-alanine amidase AmpD